MHRVYSLLFIKQYDSSLNCINNETVFTYLFYLFVLCDHLGESSSDVIGCESCSDWSVTTLYFRSIYCLLRSVGFICKSCMSGSRATGSCCSIGFKVLILSLCTSFLLCQSLLVVCAVSDTLFSRVQKHNTII